MVGKSFSYLRFLDPSITPDKQEKPSRVLHNSQEHTINNRDRIEGPMTAPLSSHLVDNAGVHVMFVQGSRIGFW